MAVWAPNRAMMGSRPWGTAATQPTNSLFTAPTWGQGYAGTGYGGYYDPSQNYGRGTSAVTTPLVSGPSGYLAENPQAAYARYTAPFAMGEDPFSRFVRNQYGQAYQGFQAALATNPNLSFYGQYLPGLGGEQYFRNRFLSQAPMARGESPVGRMRWFQQY